MFKNSSGALLGATPAVALPTLMAAALFSASSAFAQVGAGASGVDPSGAADLPAAESGPPFTPYPPPGLDTAVPDESVAVPDASSEHRAGAVTELTADMVYAVLVGEVAVQREDHRLAFTHYLHAARLSRDPAMAELAARAALSLGDPKAAVRATMLWAELAPDSARARQIGAYAQIDAGDRTAALAELADLIRLAPDRGQGYMQAAQMLARVPEPAERLAMMRELVADDVDDADAQYALAMLAAGADDMQAAREHAERAAALRPGWNDPRVFIVRLLVSDDRRDEAVSVLDGFLAAEPNDLELQLLRAQLYSDAEEYEAALALFDDILARGPGQPDVLFTAAVLALEIESVDKAREYLTQLRATGARANDSAFLLGQTEELAGNKSLAMDWYAKVNGENTTNARVRIAGIHADQGEVPRAREILQQLRDQFPADVTTLYLIEGELLRERDLQQQALDVYTDGLSASPDNPDLLYARAMLAVGMDRIDLLEQDLRRILISDPDHVDALNALGYTLADRTDRFDEAQSLIARALQLRPDEPAILDSMGWVLYRRGNPQDAEPYLRKALEGVFDAEIAAHLGEVLWALDKHDEAREVWERALAEDPKHEYLLRTMGRHRITQSVQ
jgi:tetratricopeptide (TPR) repeat protein